MSSSIISASSVHYVPSPDRRHELRRASDYALSRIRSFFRVWSMASLLAIGVALYSIFVLRPAQKGVFRPDIAEYSWSGFHRIP